MTLCGGDDEKVRLFEEEIRPSYHQPADAAEIQPGPNSCGTFCRLLCWSSLFRLLSKKEGAMSRAATSIFVYSFYLIVQGVLLPVIPNVALGLFGLPSTQEVWVRVLGYSLLALVGLSDLIVTWIVITVIWIQRA
jgi:hypothetical protein